MLEKFNMDMQTLAIHGSPVLQVKITLSGSDQ